MNIKKLSMNTSSYDHDRYESSSELEDFFINVFKKCKSLEYIKFGYGDEHFCEQLVSILNGIEKGLCEIKGENREQMKIEVGEETELWDTNGAQGAIPNILRIINLLDQSGIKDFMFIWHIPYRKDVDKEILLKDIKCIECKIRAVVASDSKIIITNDNCKINGYYSQYPFDIQ